MYVDDTAICVSARNKAEVTICLQEEMSRVNEWICAFMLEQPHVYLPPTTFIK